MKKRCVFCLTVLLATVLAPGARAAEMLPYVISGFSISIPDTYDVITRDMELDGEILRLMEEADIYLEAWNEEDQEIRVIVRDMELDAPQFLDEEGIKAWIPYFEDQGRMWGDLVERSGTYRHEQTGFHRMYFRFPNAQGSYYKIQYNTVVGRKWICVEILSASAPIFPEQEAESEEIIDSIYLYRSYFLKPEGHTDAFVYRDVMTGAEFTVPENWSEELWGEDDPSNALFYLNADPDVFILYGTVDLWEQMPDWKRSGYTRETMKNPIYGDGSVAEMLDISPTEIVRKQYGDMEYIVGHAAEELSNGDGVGNRVHHTTIMEGFENGYGYYFFFPGEESHENYQDLEAMVSSVKYPGAAAASGEEQGAGRFRTQFFLAIAGIVLVGLALGFVSWRTAPKRKGGVREPEYPKYCRFCGAKLPKGGAFCEQCGTRIDS